MKRRVLPAAVMWFVAACPGKITAQTAERTTDGLAPRIAVFLVEDREPAIPIIAESALGALIDGVPGFWFIVERDILPADREQGEVSDGVIIPDPRELSAAVWERYQAELLVILSVRRSTEDETDADPPPAGRQGPRYLVSMEVYQTSSREDLRVRRLASRGEEVAVDRAGRYQRPATYGELVAALAEVRDVGIPATDLTIRSNGPFTVSGVPAYAAATAEGAVTAEDGATRTISSSGSELTLRLRSLSHYDLVLSRPGHRPESLSIYVERLPVTAEVHLTKYPRHTAGLFLRGLSWPALEYTWRPASSRWMVHGTVTSFLIGVTPLRQTTREDESAQLFTSLDLTEAEVGWSYLFGSRDNRYRWTAGASMAVRFVHGNVDFDFDPIIPATLRLAGGSEWEVGRRFSLSQRLSTDLFVSPRSSFVRDQAWLRRGGPIFWQLPIYRVGMRVRL
ncbi:MAG: hypothetical protein MI724_11170 [Spirochaetales bacterium]|nr:hypothetical protein [Spirochaetales bacterium]